MKSEWRSGRGVSERDGRSDQPRTRRGAHAPGGARMAAIGVLGSVDELADGTGGSVDAVTEAAMGPYRKSRFIRRARHPGPRACSLRGTPDKSLFVGPRKEGGPVLVQTSVYENLGDYLKRG